MSDHKFEHLNTQDSKLVIKKENFDKAYELLRNYDKTCESAIEILEAEGFQLSFDDDGNIVALWYDDNAYDQMTYLDALAPVVENESCIVFMTDVDCRDIFRCFFKDGKMYEQKAKVEISWPELDI